MCVVHSLYCPICQLEKTKCSCHSSIDEQAGAIDVARARTAQKRNDVRYFFAFRRAFNRNDCSNLPLDLRILPEFFVQQRRAYPGGTYSVDSYAIGGMIKA